MNSENFESKNLHLIPEVTDWTGAVRGMFTNRGKSQYEEENIALFDEKERNYDGPSLRAESTYSFLDRSSLTGYAHLRQMLQRWVDHLPLEKQKSIVGEMRHRGRGSLSEEKGFYGAFFELFLHEFLNGTGGQVVVEPKIGGNPPRFRRYRKRAKAGRRSTMWWRRPTSTSYATRNWSPTGMKGAPSTS